MGSMSTILIPLVGNNGVTTNRARHRSEQKRYLTPLHSTDTPVSAVRTSLPDTGSRVVSGCALMSILLGAWSDRGLFVAYENGFDGVDRPKILPSRVLGLGGNTVGTAMVAFDDPATHQDVPAISDPDLFRIASGGFGEKPARTEIPMAAVFVRRHDADGGIICRRGDDGGASCRLSCPRESSPTR